MVSDPPLRRDKNSSALGVAGFRLIITTTTTICCWHCCRRYLAASSRGEVAKFATKKRTGATPSRALRRMAGRTSLFGFLVLLWASLGSGDRGLKPRHENRDIFRRIWVRHNTRRHVTTRVAWLASVGGCAFSPPPLLHTTPSVSKKVRHRRLSRSHGRSWLLTTLLCSRTSACAKYLGSSEPAVSAAGACQAQVHDSLQ